MASGARAEYSTDRAGRSCCRRSARVGQGRAPAATPRATRRWASSGLRRGGRWLRRTDVLAESVLDTIGRTPLIELKHCSPDPDIRFFAKLEGRNPTGSVKDRIVLAMVREAERDGRLRPGATIIEASTGNTGIAL